MSHKAAGVLITVDIVIPRLSLPSSQWEGVLLLVMTARVFPAPFTIFLTRLPASVRDAKGNYLLARANSHRKNSS